MDLELFETLFHANYTKVYRTVYRVISDEQLTLDAVQEAYCKGFKNIKQLRDKSKFSAWIISIAVNYALDEIRKTKKVIPMEITDCNFINTNSKADLPDEVYEKKESKEMLNKLLLELVPEFREVVYLRYYLDLQYSEIAAVLDIKEGTVKSRLFRAKAMLLGNLQMQSEDYSLLKEANNDGK